MNELDAEQREFYAKELLENPIYQALMVRLEKEAIDRAVSAPLTDHLAHQAALAEVRAIRSFRHNCEFILRNKPSMKAPPA